MRHFCCFKNVFKLCLLVWLRSTYLLVHYHYNISRFEGKMSLLLTYLVPSKVRFVMINDTTTCVWVVHELIKYKLLRHIPTLAVEFTWNRTSPVQKSLTFNKRRRFHRTNLFYRIFYLGMPWWTSYLPFIVSPLSCGATF